MPQAIRPGCSSPGSGAGPHMYRRGSTSHRSSTSSFSDDEDAITPCPLAAEPQIQETNEQQQETQPTAMHGRLPHPPKRHSWRESQAPLDTHEHDAGSPGSSSSGSSANMGISTDDVDPETLWRRMLAIQRMFGCYNSARMRAALDMGPGGVDELVRMSFNFPYLVSSRALSFAVRCARR